MINHVIDPTFFYDAIDEFSFPYTLYRRTGKTINEYGKSVSTYTQLPIYGSIQSQGKSLQQSKTGNTISSTYNFYCKSLYRIDIGDIIDYHHNYLRVDSVKDYDEYGVRSCSLTMIKLTSYVDLADYIKFISGEEVV